MDDFMKFMQASPTAFHAVANLAEMLVAAGIRRWRSDSPGGFKGAENTM